MEHDVSLQHSNDSAVSNYTQPLPFSEHDQSQYSSQ